MRLTKFGHSCVLVEVDEGGRGRAGLFDPGGWSDVHVDKIAWIDDVFISHIHGDHMDLDRLHQVVGKFPDVRITGPTEVVTFLRKHGFKQAADVMPADTVAFVSPHEEVRPFGSVVPAEIGIHFMGVYTHPGDSHSFAKTMSVLALPVVAPWGSTRRALELALHLKPKYVLPVHDWFLSDTARIWTYQTMAGILASAGIKLLMPENGVTLEVNI